MVSIDGSDISGATIDGTQVQEITVDGTTVWTYRYLEDHFNDNTFDTSRWTKYQEQGTATINEENQQLYLTSYGHNDTAAVISNVTIDPPVHLECDMRNDPYAGNSGDGGMSFVFGAWNPSTSKNSGEFVKWEFPRYYLDNSWHCMTGDGSNTTDHDTGDNSEGQLRFYEIDWYTDRVEFLLNDSLVHTATSAIPTGNLNCWIQVERGNSTGRRADGRWDNVLITPL